MKRRRTVTTKKQSNSSHAYRKQNCTKGFVIVVEDDGSTPWNWADGEAYCETIGTGYYSINSPTKQANVESLASENSVDIKAWSGLKYDGTNWVWSDGSQDNGYTNWLTAPTILRGSSRASLRFDRTSPNFGKWKEFPKGRGHGALVCGKEATTSTTLPPEEASCEVLEETVANLSQMAVFFSLKKKN